MVLLGALFGAVAGVSGAVLSSVVPGLPTGPTIVLVLSAVVFVSIVFAPARGLVWRRLRLGRISDPALLDPVLMHLYALSLQHKDDPNHGHTVAVLRTMSPLEADVAAALAGLEVRGLARQVGAGLWAPTAVGRREAQRIWDRQEGSAP
jgi:manganese/zinc/iron transport system permease protein